MSGWIVQQSSVSNAQCRLAVRIYVYQTRIILIDTTKGLPETIPRI
jgi:hypothetical protein